jgi:hypothetical protein
VLRCELWFMDATAVSLCTDDDLPIVVFDLMRAGNVVRGRARRADRHAGKPVRALRAGHGMIPGPGRTMETRGCADRTRTGTPTEAREP